MPPTHRLLIRELVRRVRHRVVLAWRVCARVLSARRKNKERAVASPLRARLQACARGGRAGGGAPGQLCERGARVRVFAFVRRRMRTSFGGGGGREESRGEAESAAAAGARPTSPAPLVQPPARDKDSSLVGRRSSSNTHRHIHTTLSHISTADVCRARLARGEETRRRGRRRSTGTCVLFRPARHSAPSSAPPIDIPDL